MDEELMQGEHPKVSVIIPVYNPGPGIRRCISSLRNQTLREIELIFIDDLSTDGAMDEVLSAAGQDSRIRIIRNPVNLGPGPTRNIGIESSRGTYLAFVDPDDFIEPDFLSLLYEKAETEGLDIVKGSCMFCRETKNGEMIREPRNALTNQIREGIQEGKQLFCLFTFQHWTALYRRELVVASARYGTSRVAQDVTFQLQVTSVAKTFGIEERANYCYVYRQESVSRHIDRVYLQENLKAFHEQCMFLKNMWPLQPAADQYAIIKTEVMLTIHRYAATIMPEAAESFLNDLRREILDLPFAWEMIRKAFYVRTLVLKGLNLTDKLFNPEVKDGFEKNWFFVYEAWVQYALSAPGVYTNFCRKRLKTV